MKTNKQANKQTNNQTVHYIVQTELVCNPETGETIPKLTVWGTFTEFGTLKRFVQYMLDSFVSGWYTTFEIVTVTPDRNKYTMPMFEFIGTFDIKKRTFKERVEDNA